MEENKRKVLMVRETRRVEEMDLEELLIVMFDQASTRIINSVVSSDAILYIRKRGSIYTTVGAMKSL